MSLNTHLNMSNFPFYIMLVQYVVLPPFYKRPMYHCKVSSFPSPSKPNRGYIPSLELFWDGGVDEHPLFIGPPLGVCNATKLFPTCSSCSSISSPTSNRGYLEDLATPTTMGALILLLECISKSLPLLVLSSINKTSHMRPNTSKYAITNGLFGGLPLSLGNTGLTCCPTMHVS